MATTWGVREMKELTEAARKKKMEEEAARRNNMEREYTGSKLDTVNSDTARRTVQVKPSNVSQTAQNAQQVLAAANDRPAMVASGVNSISAYTPPNYSNGQPGNWIATGADGTETQVPMYDAAGNVVRPEISPLEQAAQENAARTLGIAGQTSGTAPGYGSISAGTTGDMGVYQTIQQMIRNGKNWAGATPEERARLEEQNLRLGATIPGAVRGDDGVWRTADGGELFETQYRAPQVETPAFSYGSYTQDPTVAAALEQAAASRSRLADWDSFSYDPEEDPLWAQYQNAYTRGGQRAMQDTLGQMAARTGGLASSYAGTAAQQSYNNYMSQMADKLPELQQAAYQRYLGDYGRAKDLYELDNNWMQTALGQYNSDRSLAYQQARDAVADQQWNAQFGYQAGRDIVGDLNTDRAFEYQQGRDAISDQRYEQEYKDQRADAERAYQMQKQQAFLAAVGSGYVPSEQDVVEAGFPASATARLQAYASYIQRSNSKYF